MNSQLSKPKIRKYTQILPYLKDLYNYKKQLDHQFNHETWSAQLGFKSSFMYFVCTGRRALTLKFIDKFSEHLKLTTSEKKHLILLASYQNVKTNDLKSAFSDKILENIDNSEIVLEAKKYFQFVSSPYIPIIRMFLAFDDYKGSVSEISKHLKIGPQKIKAALNTLEEMGLAEKYSLDSSGKIFWRTSLKAVALPQDASNHIDLFHHSTMHEAANISQQKDIFKKFRSIIFAVQPKDHDLVLAEIEKFISKIKNQFGYNEVTGKHLLKLNLQAYPVTEVVENP